MIPSAILQRIVNGPVKHDVHGCSIAGSGYPLSAKEIKPRLRDWLLFGLALLMIGGSASADSAETNYVFAQEVQNTILSEPSLAVAETNHHILSREHSNAPPYLGKLELAMALRYSHEPGSQPDRIIEHCEAALRYPLDLNDACGGWQLLGDTYKGEVDNLAQLQDKRAVSKKAVAAYLSGLKAAGTDKDWVLALKGKVVSLYVNKPYVGDILGEGDKIFPNGAVLFELLQTVEQTNYSLLPPATVNQPADGGMSFDAKEYEVEGVINEEIFGTFPGKLKAEFKVQVKDRAWLIETTELERTRGSLRSQRAGTANSTEICTLNVPINRVVEAGPTNSASSPVQRPPGGGPSLPVGAPIHILASTGKVVSNTMPLADDDEAIVPHLWLMFASHYSFQSLGTNNLLTPVYEFYSPDKAKPPRKLEADWSLMSGSGALPLRVNYYREGGMHEGFVQAAYSVTGKTNFGGTVFPSGFLFEQYAAMGGPSRDDMRVVRRAEATVTAFRPVCSIKNFLPECDNTVFVTDWRLTNAQTSNTPVKYPQRGGVTWLSVAEAKRRSEGKGTAGTSSPVFWVVFGLLLVPPVVLMLKSFKRKSVP